MAERAERATFGAALRVPEFRALWIAYSQSRAGDQLARIALSVLVFQRTESASITALVYALSFVPAIVGGTFLSGLADRFPRRSLMITCDLIRAALVAVMAIAGLSLWLLCALLIATVLVGQPFAAAEAALLPDVLSGELYVVGSGLRMMTGQIAQLAGFGLGGLVVAAIGARGGLIVDAATFAVSAAIVTALVGRRPAPLAERVTAAPGASRRRPVRAALRNTRASARALVSDPTLRTLIGLGWLAGFHIVPEGLAAPFAAATGGGPAAVGLLMAALPAGAAIGAVLFVRLPPEVRSRSVGPFAVATGIPLAACAVHPGLGVAIALWALAGAFSAFQIQAAASFVRAVPEAGRGRAIGLATSGMVAVQGIGVVAFGALAAGIGAVDAVAAAGIVATAVAIVPAIGWSRASI